MSTTQIDFYVGDEGYSVVIRSPKTMRKYGPYDDFVTAIERMGDALEIEKLGERREGLLRRLAGRAKS